MAKIAVGKPAMVTFDALPNQPFRGQVVAISPSGSLSQGVVAYRCRSIWTPALGGDSGGLTASATIAGDRPKDDFLLVPNRAVHVGRVANRSWTSWAPTASPVTRTVRTRRAE